MTERTLPAHAELGRLYLPDGGSCSSAHCWVEKNTKSMEWELFLHSPCQWEVRNVWCETCVPFLVFLIKKESVHPLRTRSKLQPTGKRSKGDLGSVGEWSEQRSVFVFSPPCHCCGVAVYICVESCLWSKLLIISSSFMAKSPPNLLICPSLTWTPIKCSFLIQAKQTKKTCVFVPRHVYLRSHINMTVPSVTNVRLCCHWAQKNPTATPHVLPPVHSWSWLGADEALLQVTENIVQHPDMGRIALFGVVCRPHHFWLEESCVVSERGGCVQQGRRYHAPLWRQGREEHSRVAGGWRVEQTTRSSSSKAVKCKGSVTNDFISSILARKTQS